MRKLVLLTVLGLLGIASPAAAAPVWNLDLHHNQTNFPPGGTAEFWVDVANVGDAASSGLTTVSIDLPSGITRDKVALHGMGVAWNCPGAAGSSTVVCSTTDSIPRHSVSRNLVLTVDVAPGVSGGRFTTATVGGGGAAAPANAAELTRLSAQPAGFGIAEGSWLADFYEADGLTPERRAGSHPDLATFSFDLNTIQHPNPPGSDPDRKVAAGFLRDAEVKLPRGFVGDPTAIGECGAAELSALICPPSSQVGRADLHLYDYAASHYFDVSTGVFNMTHPRGSIADLGFQVIGVPVHVRASLDPERGYSIETSVSNITETLPPFDSKVTIWGVPADPSHDSERCPEFSAKQGGDTSESCAAGIPAKPFLTVPAECSTGKLMLLSRYDSWQEPDVFGPDLAYPMPGSFGECDHPRFDPAIAIDPTGTEAGTPTGLDVSVHVPQNDNPNALATPAIKSTTVVLPEGMAVNPAFSDGLEGCSEAEIGLGSDSPVRCPDNSRIGAVEVSTPLLPRALEGSMYLAEQGGNPFGSLLAFYLAIHDTEERGVLVKVPGEVRLDPKTGQITTVFDDLPQFPFEDLTLKFRSGERAPLVNPPTCGTHGIEATMTSYAQPDKELDVSDVYDLREGPGGSPCVSSLPDRPFDPQLLAGTINPVAGAFSPLHLRVSRSDADQEISSVRGTAPQGVSASLIGTERCSEAQIAQALGRNAPGEGAKEKSDPSCPASSQVGTVDTGAGAGPSPIYVPGRIYLAGPYKGAPLSGVAIVPAVAGPVDLGVVVVRAPAYLDPRTAQLSISSDELPQVVNGVLVRVRDVRIRLDRPNFTINPTSCREKSVEGTVLSAEGKSAELANRFQVGECGSLAFKPRIALRLKGGARRGSYPALTAVVRPRLGDANFRRAVVTLPGSAFLEQAHIRTICTRVQFAAGQGNGAQCPKGAVYGSAKAWSPLVEGAFEGPVYLRSSNNRLPDMVVALKGPEDLPIDIELSSRIDSVRLGREAVGIRSTFTAVPDVPVSRFVLNMRGGRKGLIVNSRNLCFKPKRNRARANLVGQNGRVEKLKPRVVSVKCAKRRKKARRKHKKAHGSHA